MSEFLGEVRGVGRERVRLTRLPNGRFRLLIDHGIEAGASSVILAPTEAVALAQMFWDAMLGDEAAPTDGVIHDVAVPLGKGSQ